MNKPLEIHIPAPDYEKEPEIPERMSKRVEQEKKKQTFIIPDGELTQEAIDGIRFDFNHGLRVSTPKDGKKYHLTFTDTYAGVVLFNATVIPGTSLASTKKFWIPMKLEIHDPETKELLYEHQFNSEGKDVVIQLPEGAVGDTIAWFSYIERFQKKHKCKLYVTMAENMAALFRKQYPDINFIGKEELVKLKPYATYYLGLYFNGDTNNQPVDFRYIGLHHTAGHILGIPCKDEPPRVDLSAKRKIKGPYVCIAAQASSMTKMWNNPTGWYDVVKFLKENGYRVLCIDKEPATACGTHCNRIPNGCEDFTGNKPLQERVDLLKYADFFIGTSSGLSWLAWCCKIPVVMISGFTHPNNEFYTPYRVVNYHVCNSCWNDMRERFDHSDFMWCPRHKNDEHHLECSRLIAAQHVINVIKEIPAFQKHRKTTAVENKEK